MVAEQLMAEVAELKAFLQEAEGRGRQLDKELEDALAVIPNVPLDDVPVGPDETANVEYRRWGEKPGLNDAREHYALGEALGQMDFEAAAKLSGARFVVLKKGLARMERALGQFMLDLHTTEHGYEEVQPPLLVRDEVMFGTAQLPKFEDDQYLSTTLEHAAGDAAEILVELSRVEAQALSGDEWLTKTRNLSRTLTRLGYSEPVIKQAMERALARATIRMQEDALLESRKGLPEFEGVSEGVLRRLPEFDEARARIAAKREVGRKLSADKASPNRLWLVPTAEVPLTNLVRESIRDEDELPLRFTALTPCFRAEAGAAGKDTRGMLRQHQFDKVELVSITTPEQSRDEHERMLTSAEEVLKRLDLHYRVMTLSTGDMGFAAQKTYDIEVWLPGQGTYREISSCSVCGDFQARRMKARYRPAEGKGTRLVHTLNGSGVAVGRALIAVMENYQNPDGSITVPDALRRPYMGGRERIEA